MSVQCNKVGAKVICSFESRMDTVKCMEAEKIVLVHIADAAEVVFDLVDVDYIASSFLRLCGKSSNRVKAGNFSIINVKPAVKKVFKIAGLAERLNIK